jgi:hypothetical protein
MEDPDNRHGNTDRRFMVAECENRQKDGEDESNESREHIRTWVGRRPANESRLGCAAQEQIDSFP